MPVTGGLLEISISRVEIDGISARQFGGLKRGRYMRLVISDTGCGIPAEILPKIFDPFFTTKERDKGTGMGLSVVHGIVTDLEGNISVYSKPGRGSSFQILLPLVDEKAAASFTRARYFKRGSGTVLLVDDEEMIRLAGSGILKELGYDVITAGRGRDAVELFRSSPERFICVITDMSMPGMTGLQVAEQLKIIRPGIPILLATGFSPGITSQHLDSAGIHEMVMKPLIASELSEAIERVIHKSNG
jgi:CheY-like chemotaxis protein